MKLANPYNGLSSSYTPKEYIGICELIVWTIYSHPGNFVAPKIALYVLIL